MCGARRVVRGLLLTIFTYHTTTPHPAGTRAPPYPYLTITTAQQPPPPKRHKDQNEIITPLYPRALNTNNIQ